MPLVYLFEDDVSLRQLLTELLTEELAATVQTCADLADIVAHCTTKAPDAIVADFWGASHTALADEERAQIQALAERAPLVLVSARRWAQDADVAELGVAGLVSKPLEISEFIDVLHEAMRPRADQAANLPPREALSVFFLGSI